MYTFIDSLFFYYIDLHVCLYTINQLWIWISNTNITSTQNLVYSYDPFIFIVNAREDSIHGQGFHVGVIVHACSHAVWSLLTPPCAFSRLACACLVNPLLHAPCIHVYSTFTAVYMYIACRLKISLTQHKLDCWEVAKDEKITVAMTTRK